MSDVFFSYSSSDKERLRPIVAEFVKQGFSIWWDRYIPPGKTFDQVIEEALSAAKCVVVAWSTSSVNSNWIRTEAAEAFQRGILIPILIDDVTIPFEFRRIQAAKLLNLAELSDDPEFKALLNAVTTLIGKPLVEEPKIAEELKSEAEKKPPVSVQEKISGLYEKALELFGQQQWEDAIRRIDEIRTLDPRFVDVERISVKAEDEIIKSKPGSSEQERLIKETQAEPRMAEFCPENEWETAKVSSTENIQKQIDHPFQLLEDYAKPKPGFIERGRGIKSLWAKMPASINRAVVIFAGIGLFTILYFFIRGDGHLRGTVVDNDWTPLPGVNIELRTAEGSLKKSEELSNENGSFSFSKINGFYSLTFSLTGFKTKEVKILIKRGKATDLGRIRLEYEAPNEGTQEPKEAPKKDAGRTEPPIRAIGEIKPPKLIKQVPAIYPELARLASVQGIVVMEATTDIRGRVRSVRILSSIPLLDQAAIDAVKQWIYEPMIVDGKPRPVIFTVTCRFTLTEKLP